MLYGHRPIRRVWAGDRWYFAITDAIEAVAETGRPRHYLG